MYKKWKILLCCLLCCCLFFGCSRGYGPHFSLENAMDKIRKEREKKIEEAAVKDDVIENDVPEEMGEYYKERPNGGFTFGFLCRDLSNSFYVSVESAIREAVEANGDTLITLDSCENRTLQKEQVEKLAEKQVDGIFMCPVDMEQSPSMTEILKEKGILVVNYDTQFHSKEEAVTSIVSDNFNAGYLCGEDLSMNYTPGAFAVFRTLKVKSLADRVSGFLTALNDTKGFQYVTSVNVPSNEKDVKKGLHKLLKTYPEIRYILATNDVMGEHILDALEDMGRQDIYIYSIDGSPCMKKRFLNGNGQILGLVVQSPINIGMYSASAMYQLLDGRKLNDTYYVETFLIKKEEIAEYGIDHWQ